MKNVHPCAAALLIFEEEGGQPDGVRLCLDELGAGLSVVVTWGHQ